ncbi:MAG: NYN domain-containing protein [Oscillospiraceae bacterium]|nr:NYN domain-containing protein [Oscillospiraceae bacterium]
MQGEKELRLAVLIDADNVPRKSIKAVMEEIAVYGNPTVKRIYGDWTSPNLGGWKARLLENALTPIQQYGYTTGKNSTDSAMIIDAMDILYSDNVDGFCLVSSDSDFTRLAIRLREAGMKVFGFGEKKTPGAFIAACDRFIYIEIIFKNNEHPSAKKIRPSSSSCSADTPALPDSSSQAQAKPAPRVKLSKDVIDLIAAAVDDVGDDEGWAYLGEVGGLLQKKRPDFDSRNYGFKKLTSLIESCEHFELDFRQNLQRASGKLIYIRSRKMSESQEISL